MKKYITLAIVILLSQTALATPAEQPQPHKNAYADLAAGPAGPGDTSTSPEKMPSIEELTRPRFNFVMEKPSLPADKPSAPAASVSKERK